MTGGSRKGVPTKRRFISRLTEDVNALGYAERSEKQVEQKIRDEIKVMKKYGNALAAGMKKTGGGKMATLPRLSAAQKRAFDMLQERPRISGVSGGLEVGQNPSMEITSSEDTASALASAPPPQP